MIKWNRAIPLLAFSGSSRDCCSYCYGDAHTSCKYFGRVYYSYTSGKALHSTNISDMQISYAYTFTYLFGPNEYLLRDDVQYSNETMWIYTSFGDDCGHWKECGNDKTVARYNFY